MHEHPEKLKLSKEINTKEAQKFGSMDNLGKDAPIISIPYNNARLNKRILENNQLVDLVKKAKDTLNVNQIKIFEGIVVELSKLYDKFDNLSKDIYDGDSPLVLKEKKEQILEIESEIEFNENKLKIMSEQD